MLDTMAPPLPPPAQRHHQADTGHSGSLVLLRSDNSSSPAPNEAITNSPASPEPSSSYPPTVISSPSKKQYNELNETTIKSQDQNKYSHNLATTTTDGTVNAQQQQIVSSSLNLHNNECNMPSKRQQDSAPVVSTKKPGQVVHSNKAISLSQASNHVNTTSGNTYQPRKYNNSSSLNHHNNLIGNYSTTSTKSNGTISSNNSRLNNQQRNSHSSSSSHFDQKNVYHHSYNHHQHSHNHNHSQHLHHSQQQQHHFSQQPNHSTFGTNSSLNDTHQQRSRHHNHHQNSQQQPHEFHMPSFNHLSHSETSLPNSDVASNTSSVASQRAMNGPPHYVDLHVNAGECVSLQLLDGQEQVLTGPATITMVSHQQNPPVPIPVQVPPGHLVHQIADESGTLKHIILSIMVNEVDSSQLNSTIINMPHGSFSINELVDVSATSISDDRDPLNHNANSAIFHLPRQAHVTDANQFANYDGSPVAVQNLDESFAPYQKHNTSEAIEKKQTGHDEAKPARKTTADKSSVSTLTNNNDGLLDVSSIAYRDKNDSSANSASTNNVAKSYDKNSPQETSTTASENSQNIQSSTVNSTTATSLNKIDNDSEVPTTDSSKQHPLANNQQVDTIPEASARLHDLSISTSLDEPSAYQQVMSTDNLDQAALLTSDAMADQQMIQTVDGQLYGYTQPCCCFYYCDPQQAVAAASSIGNEDQQPPTVGPVSVDAQDVIILPPDHQQPSSMAPAPAGITSVSNVSSHRGSMNNVNPINTNVLPYHHHQTHMTSPHGSIGLPSAIASGSMMSSQALHPLTGQNGLVPLSSSGHFPEIGGGLGMSVHKVHKNSRNSSNHYKHHKLHTGSGMHTRGHSGDRRQAGYINHHYHNLSSYNNLADNSNHHNQDAYHVTSYNKPSSGLMSQPKQNMSATQVGSSTQNNAYSAPYTNYGHRPTTRASTASGGNKSKHLHHSNLQPNVHLLTQQLSSQVYRASELEMSQGSVRGGRSDLTNNFASNVGTGFKFQGGENVNNNKRSPHAVSTDKSSKFNSSGRLLSGNQTPLVNQQQQHHEYQSTSAPTPPARPSSKKKNSSSLDHQNHHLQQQNVQQQTPTKSLHNDAHETCSIIDSGKENVELFEKQAVQTTADNLLVNQEQDRSVKQNHHVSDMVTSTSPTVDSSTHRQNRKSVNLSLDRNEKPSTHERVASNSPLSFGNEASLKIQGNKQQSHEISGSDGNINVGETRINSFPRSSRGKQKKTQPKTSPKQSNQVPSSVQTSSNESTKPAGKNQRAKAPSEPKSNLNHHISEEGAKVKSQQKKANNKQQDLNSRQVFAFDELKLTVETELNNSNSRKSNLKSASEVVESKPNSNDSEKKPEQHLSLANRGNASSHISNTHHQGNKSSGHHHHPIKISNFVKQCRTKLVSAVGTLVRNSLSSYSDTKFAGVLLVLFTIFAMLLAIFIHFYIVAPVNE